MYVAGIDIGGTKCAVSIGKVTDREVETVDKEKIWTPKAPEEAVGQMIRMLHTLLERHPQVELAGIGISCGSPLDSEKGIILSPPNLPDWDGIEIVRAFEEEFHLPAALQNDANACALAEWIWGAGAGSRNMIFLTFGTGMGAGLILDGRLYTGTSDMAGEVGHIRLEKDGPVGYHKAGSFEGFCSGGGIARLGENMLKQWQAEGRATVLDRIFRERNELTTADIAGAANEGDALAGEIFDIAGKKLGQGLAILIDLLNPEVIVIGSIFARQERLLRKPMEEVMKQEALSFNLDDCRVKAAKLGEAIGDYAAYSVAVNHLKKA